jgi:hypothetical protein
MLAHIWQARTEYVGTHMIEHESFMLSWAAKWESEPEVLSDVLTPEEAIHQDDERILTSLADLLRSADIIVAHNGDRFDIPKVNTRLLLMNLEPLGPVKSFDTLKAARSTFRLASNKLDWIAEQLGFGNKLPTSFDLWRRCYQGDPQALDEMVTYNRQDVVLLQKVYEALQGYVKGVPRMVDAGGISGLACPTCGQRDMKRRGWHRTNASTFPRFYCPSCRRYSRSRQAAPAKRLTLSPL